jgi:hypothetical protein
MSTLLFLFSSDKPSGFFLEYGVDNNPSGEGGGFFCLLLRAGAEMGVSEMLTDRLSFLVFDSLPSCKSGEWCVGSGAEEKEKEKDL